MAASSTGPARLGRFDADSWIYFCCFTSFRACEISARFERHFHKCRSKISATILIGSLYYDREHRVTECMLCLVNLCSGKTIHEEMNTVFSSSLYECILSRFMDIFPAYLNSCRNLAGPIIIYGTRRRVVYVYTAYKNAA